MLCEKYPNRKIYVIGDQHFYHINIVKYSRSQFSDVLEMNHYIIEMHNRVVDKEDICIFLGDFCFKNSAVKDILERMNGHKYLILGNHDSINLIKNYPNLGFEGVFTMPIKINDHYLSHEPLSDGERNDLQFKLIVDEFKKHSKGVNFHGHIHTNDIYLNERYRNVTCEMLDYQPVMIGKTVNIKLDERPLFINSSYFDKILTNLKEKHNLAPSLLLGDYIYSTLLSASSDYEDLYFVQGSFGLFKKYKFLSNFSDLDISFLYNDSISQNKNYSLFKTMVDECYECLKQINGINLSFLKRYTSPRIFEAIYTSQYPYFTKCTLDSNLVLLNCYRKSDFIQLEEGNTIIQKHLMKHSSSLLSEYQFPEFQSQFLVPEADLASLLLHFSFQNGYEEKRPIILKKISYIFRHVFSEQYIDEDYFSDVFLRFFLRNISLLYSFNRYSEIEYIQSRESDISSLLSYFPIQLQELISHIFFDKDSKFLDVYEELSSVPTMETFQECSKIMRKINRKHL